jgi:hypothetical protein
MAERDSTRAVTHYQETRVTGGQMLQLIEQIRGEKRTGELYVDFSQGHPAAILWREKLKQE